jgi:hypothetical protein
MSDHPSGQERQLKLRLYQAYLDAQDTTPFAGRFMGYNWCSLPSPMSAQWMPYSSMLDEFARELANSINTLTNHVHRLQSWAKVIETLTDDEKMEVTHEFIDAIATNAVTMPYVVKSRFAFAAAHLCHQANKAKNPDTWRDDIPLTDAIYLNTTDKFGQDWNGYNRFKRRVEAISGKAFKNATGDFRNSYNHRFSPRFVIGMSELVTRQVNDVTGGIVYAFGGRQPLEVKLVADLLASECERCYLSFEALQTLVREHVEAIIAFDTAQV